MTERGRPRVRLDLAEADGCRGSAREMPCFVYCATGGRRGGRSVRDVVGIELR